MYKKEEDKIIRKKIRRGKYVTIKPNKNFYNFYKKLKIYFKNNEMSKYQIDLVERSKDQYYTFGTSVRWSQYEIKIFEENTCCIEFLPHKDGIELYWLEIFQRGKGFGTTFMNAFKQIAEELNIKIYLIPAPLNHDYQVDPQRRRDFYHRFNFKRMEDSRYWVN